MIKGMVAILKRWVLLIDLPYTLRELQQKGYGRVFLEIDRETKRVEIRAWRRQKK